MEEVTLRVGISVLCFYPGVMLGYIHDNQRMKSHRHASTWPRTRQNSLWDILWSRLYLHGRRHIGLPAQLSSQAYPPPHPPTTIANFCLFFKTSRVCLFVCLFVIYVFFLFFWLYCNFLIFFYKSKSFSYEDFRSWTCIFEDER